MTDTPPAVGSGQTDARPLIRWHPVRRAAEEGRRISRALRSGSSGMRALGVAVLPLNARERDKSNPDAATDYRRRLDSTFLLPGYATAVEDIGGRPFQRGVTVEALDQLDEKLRTIVDDADRRGSPLVKWARDTFTEGLDAGGVYCLVMMPPLEVAELAPTDGEPAADAAVTVRNLNDKEAEAQDIRPYFERVTTDQLINWGWADGEQKRLAWIVTHKERAAVKDNGNEVTIADVLYYSETEWIRYRREVPLVRRVPECGYQEKGLSALVAQAARDVESGRRGGYVEIGRGEHDHGEVPIEWFGPDVDPDGTDPLEFRAPMRALRDKNVEHWQSSSEQREALHFGRRSTTAGAGLSEDDMEKIRAGQGHGALALSQDQNFKLWTVEVSGAGITAGAADLAELARQMKELGQQPLIISEGGPMTATGTGAQELRTQARAQAWAEEFEWFLYRCFDRAAKWLRQDLPDEFDTKVFRQFGFLARRAEILDTIDKWRTRGDISRATAWDVGTALEVLPEDFDPEVEKERLTEEQNAVMDGMMTAPPPEVDPETGEPIDAEDPAETLDENGQPIADPAADPAQPVDGTPTPPVVAPGQPPVPGEPPPRRMSPAMIRAQQRAKAKAPQLRAAMRGVMGTGA